MLDKLNLDEDEIVNPFGLSEDEGETWNEENTNKPIEEVAEKFDEETTEEVAEETPEEIEEPKEESIEPKKVKRISRRKWFFHAQWFWLGEYSLLLCYVPLFLIEGVKGWEMNLIFILVLITHMK